MARQFRVGIFLTSPEFCMNSAQLYFTSIDDVVLIADEHQQMVLCNYNKDIHHEMFVGIHDFIRIPSLNSPNFEISLSNCFSDIATTFLIDQLTMLNLRIIIEVLETTDVTKSFEAQQAHMNIKEWINKDKHSSIVKLEKQLDKENSLEFLKFFNTENRLVHDEMTINMIEKV